MLGFNSALGASLQQIDVGLFEALAHTSAADLLQLVSIASAVAIVIYQQHKSVQAQRIEIYQRLEI